MYGRNVSAMHHVHEDARHVLQAANPAPPSLARGRPVSGSAHSTLTHEYNPPQHMSSRRASIRCYWHACITHMCVNRSTTNATRARHQLAVHFVHVRSVDMRVSTMHHQPCALNPSVILALPPTAPQQSYRTPATHRYTLRAHASVHGLMS